MIDELFNVVDDADRMAIYIRGIKNPPPECVLIYEKNRKEILDPIFAKADKEFLESLTDAQKARLKKV